MTSSLRRKLLTTAWSAGAGIERSVLTEPSVLKTISIGLALFAAAVLPGAASAAWGDGQRVANAPSAKASASVPPPGVILEEAPAEASAEPVTEAAAEVAPEPNDSIVLVALADTATTVAQQNDAQKAAQKSAQKDKDAAKNACGEQSKDCKEALRNLRDDRIETIALDIRVGGRPGSDYPCECRLEGETFQPRRFATTTMTWKAAGNCHKPLYFEDWNLERYGHSHGPLDPVFSAAHFFVTLPVLPYKMGVELPWECVYPLGYYRPGNCAPWTVPAVPISCRGFALEAATVTGLVFLLP